MHHGVKSRFGSLHHGVPHVYATIFYVKFLERIIAIF